MSAVEGIDSRNTTTNSRQSDSRNSNTSSSRVAIGGKSKPSTPAEEDERVLTMHTVNHAIKALLDDPQSQRTILHDNSNASTAQIFEALLDERSRDMSSTKLTAAISSGIDLEEDELAALIDGHFRTVTAAGEEEEPAEGAPPVIVSDGTDPKSIAARNALADYCSELVTFVRFEASENVPRFAIEELVDNIRKWLSDTPDATAAEVAEVQEQLEHELVSSGVALELELGAMETRKEYERELLKFNNWLANTKHETGDRQPLSEAARYLLSDFSAYESQWVADYETIACPRQEFVDRTKSIRALFGGQDTYAARQVKILHVAKRSGLLRSKPPESLSLEKRRKALTLTEEINDWLDQHRDDASDEDLADRLHQIVYLEAVGAQAADVVKAKNELEYYLDYLQSACERRPHIIQSIGEPSRVAIFTMATRAKDWLHDNPTANYDTIMLLTREIRLRAAEEGLSAVESIHAMQESEQRDEDGLPIDSSPPGKPVANTKEMTQVDVACALTQELLSLKVACRRVKTKEVQDFMRGELEQTITMAKAAAGVGGDVSVSQTRLVERYRKVLETCEELQVKVPSTCWSRLDM